LGLEHSKGFRHATQGEKLEQLFLLPFWAQATNWRMLSKDFAHYFGEAVRKHRKARGLSQEELAERADLTSKMISLIERSERNPSLNVADSIATGLGVPLSQLIQEAEELRIAKPSIRACLKKGGSRGIMPAA
jgi:ribosome-binding protein aMBF1 (putative translation factor)